MLEEIKSLDTVQEHSKTISKNRQKLKESLRILENQYVFK